MAANTYKEKTSKAEKVKGEKKPFFKFDPAIFKDERTKLAFGIFLIAFSMAMLIAFTSYLFTGKLDQSVLNGLADSSIQESGKEVENWLGIFGAWLAHIFMFKWFGISSFLLIPICFLSGYKILYKKEVPYFERLVKASLFFMIWVSFALGFLANYAEQNNFLNMICGGIGFELASFSKSLAGIGTILFLALGLFTFFIFFFDVKSFDFKKNKSNEEDTSIANNISTDIKESYLDENEDEEELTEEELSEMKVIIKEELPKPPPVFTPSIQKPVVEEDFLTIPKTYSKPNTPSLDLEIPDLDEEIPFEVDERTTEEISSDLVSKFGQYDSTLDLADYKYPSVELLNEYAGNKVQVTRDELEANKDRIVETLGNYKIGISSIKATIGPTVTLYEIVPEAGVKISKIKNLEDDIALSLAALGIRIIAPIPGKGAIGIEVPNKSRETVSMKSVLNSPDFIKTDKALPVVLGKTISNEPFIIDLAKMPHMLIAGATGQGKSVGINVLLTSLLYKKHPSQLKFVLVDPKKVELAIYSTIERHFLAKLPDAEEAIITDTKKVVFTLNSLCIEMDTRYDLLKDAGCRNLKEYNQKFVERKLNPEEGHRFLPYIVVVIDELADLMMTAGKEVETPIARLAQLARAIGIHLVVATQRPSVNVITGIIKANFPARLSFRVTSKIDSRTILDAGGAEQLVGMGDMLFSQGSDLTRIQCAFVDTPEVEAVCEFIGSQRGYSSALMLPEYADESAESGLSDVDLGDRDPLFDDAARLIVTHQQGSTSLIQRKMKLGYNRAGRIIDQLEAAGVVGPFTGSKARDVLVPDEYSLELKLSEINNKNR